MLYPTLIFQIYVCWAPGTVTDTLSSRCGSFQIRKLQINSVDVSEADIWSRHLQEYLWQNTWAADIRGENTFVLCFEVVRCMISLHTNTPLTETRQKQPHPASFSALPCRLEFSNAQISHALKSRRHQCWVVFSLPVMPLNDELADAFVSATYLPGHWGNNCNVWLRENRANHQWLQDIQRMWWHLVYYPLLSSRQSCTDRRPRLRASSMLIWFILAFHNNWGHGSARWIRSEHDRMWNSCTVCVARPPSPRWLGVRFSAVRLWRVQLRMWMVGKCWKLSQEVALKDAERLLPHPKVRISLNSLF